MELSGKGFIGGIVPGPPAAVCNVAPIAPQQPTGTVHKSDTRRNRREAHLEAHCLQPPLPIAWRIVQMPKSAAMSLVPDMQNVVGNPSDTVDLYQLYQRPKGGLVRDHRNYTYDPADKFGVLQLNRPKPTPLFHVDKAVLSREPYEILGRSEAAPPPRGSSERIFWDRKLLIRKCMLDIYRASSYYFVRCDLSLNGIDDEDHARASAVCRALFNDELTKEQVLAWGFHEEALKGDTYKYYQKKFLGEYATKAEDRLSFLCMAVPNSYPGTWHGINPCLFLAADNPKHSSLADPENAEHFAKAKILAKAITQGIFVKNQEGEWIERPELAALADYEITSTRGGNETKAVLPKESKETSVLVEQQQVKLSQAGAAILHLNETQLDNVVKRFKSLLPARTRRQERFSSDELDAKGRDRKRARKSVSSPAAAVASAQVVSNNNMNVVASNMNMMNSNGSANQLKDKFDKMQRDNVALREVASRRAKKVGVLLSTMNKQTLLIIYSNLNLQRDTDAPESVEDLRNEILSEWEAIPEEVDDDDESGSDKGGDE